MKQRLLQQQEQHTHPQAHEQRAAQQTAHTARIIASIGLRREATGAHAEKAHRPIHHAKDHGAHGDSGDIGGGAYMAHDRQVDKTQQGYRDVAHDARQGKTQNLAIGLVPFHDNDKVSKR